jgi:hypothetical protein
MTGKIKTDPTVPAMPQPQEILILPANLAVVATGNIPCAFV